VGFGSWNVRPPRSRPLAYQPRFRRGSLADRVSSREPKSREIVTAGRLEPKASETRARTGDQGGGRARDSSHAPTGYSRRVMKFHRPAACASKAPTQQ
jgi:hypothetical protein